MSRLLLALVSCITSLLAEACSGLLCSSVPASKHWYSLSIMLSHWSACLAGYRRHFPQLGGFRFNKSFVLHRRKDGPEALRLSSSSNNAVGGSRKRSASPEPPSKHTTQQKKKRNSMAAQNKAMNDIGIECCGYDSIKKQTGLGSSNGKSNAKQSRLTHDKSAVYQMAIDNMLLFIHLLEVLGLSAEQRRELLKDILVLEKDNNPDGDEEPLPEWAGFDGSDSESPSAENDHSQRIQRQSPLFRHRLGSLLLDNGRRDLARHVSDWQNQRQRL